MSDPSFFDVLRADGPASDRADKMRLYGWLIGSWRMDAVVHGDDGTQHKFCRRPIELGGAKTRSKLA
jgi:hypothetical protein